MAAQNHKMFEFGPFRLDPSRRTLHKEGEMVLLTPRVFDTLLVLVTNSGRVVEKDEIMKAVWADAFVEESSMTQNISLLRKALGEKQNGEKYIETIPKRGYCFVASVEALSDSVGRPTTDGNDEQRSQPGAAAGASETMLSRSRSRGWVTVSLISILCLSAAGFGLYQYFGKSGPKFQTIKITKLTDSGFWRDAALSPDGKLVAYVLDELGQESIKLRQVGTGNTTDLVAPTGVRYAALTFSPDGNHLYYVKYEKDSPQNALYQIPTIGGNSKRVLTDIESSVTFSPDGRRFAFLRRSSKMALVVARLDGTDEQEVVTLEEPGTTFAFYPCGPSWSPDGERIAYSVSINPGQGRVPEVQLLTVHTRDNVVSRISDSDWSEINGLSWLSDNKGLIVTGRRYKGNRQPQYVRGLIDLWYVTYPDGEVRGVSNGVNNFEGISLDVRSVSMVTRFTGTLSSIMVAAINSPDRTEYLSSGTGVYFGVSGLPDGRLVYSLGADGKKTDIWIMNPDGTGARRLTETDCFNLFPAISPDGRSIVFGSNRVNNGRLWVMDTDGNNQRQLNEAGQIASYSPDGNNIFYSSYENGLLSIFKMPAGGGDRTHLSTKITCSPTVSPDGKYVAYHYSGDKEGSDRGLAIMPIEGGDPIKQFGKSVAFAVTTPSRWTPDGKGIAYIETRGGVSNIWVQPVDGRPAKQLTDFKANKIQWFDWSFDKRQVLYIFNTPTSDIVLIESVD